MLMILVDYDLLNCVDVNTWWCNGGFLVGILYDGGIIYMML